MDHPSISEASHKAPGLPSPPLSPAAEPFYPLTSHPSQRVTSIRKTSHAALSTSAKGWNVNVNDAKSVCTRSTAAKPAKRKKKTAAGEGG